jgi:hypothetical protein
LGPAVAAAETKENTTQFEVIAGTLKFVTAPVVPSLSSVTIKGEAQTTHGTMNNFSVQDATRERCWLECDRSGADRHWQERRLQAVL